MIDNMAVVNAKMAGEFINKFVTYKPGYRLQANVPLDTEFESLHLMLTFTAPDSDIGDTDEKKMLYFTRCYIWPHWATIQFVKEILTGFVHEWETHEADEWLRVGGVKVHDPHA